MSKAAQEQQIAGGQTFVPPQVMGPSEGLQFLGPKILPFS